MTRTLPAMPFGRRSAHGGWGGVVGNAATADGSAFAVLVAASIGAGVIHLVLGPEHIEELGSLGVGFYLSGVLQLGWAAVAAVLFLGRRRYDARTLVITGIAINAVILAAWAVSRIVGLPAGEQPWTPEAIGPADGIASLLETGIVIGLATSLGTRRVAQRAAWRSVAVAAFAVVLIVLGTLVALGASESGHSHAPDHEHASGGEAIAAGR